MEAKPDGMMQTFVEQVEAAEQKCLYYPFDHATQDRQDRLWRAQHPVLLRATWVTCLAGCYGLVYVAYRCVRGMIWLVWGV